MGGSSENDQHLTDLFNIYGSHIYAYALRRVGAEGAQDIVSDTFLEAWRHIATLQPDPLPWLYRTAAFQIAHRRRDLDRRTRINNAVQLNDDNADEHDFAADVSNADGWISGFSKLSNSDQEILRLVAWENLTPGEAAATLGCELVTFKVRLHRARRRLLAIVKEEMSISSNSDDKGRKGRSKTQSVVLEVSPNLPIESPQISQVHVNAPHACDIATPLKEI